MDSSVVTLDISCMSDEEKLTALALQGLVNRGGPQLYYYARFWNWPEADRKWVEYLEQARGFRFTPPQGTLADLVARFRNRLRGLVVWDPRQEKTRWVALTLAGLHDLLPVAPECIERYALPVVEDLRGRWKARLEPVRWSLTALLPACNRHVVYSADRLWSGWSLDALDYAVRERAFCYSLKPGGSDAPAGEVELLHQVLSQVGPLARVMGWAEPEYDYCLAATLHGHFIYCAEAANLSFFAGVPARYERLEQPARRAGRQPTLENKHYLAFNASEGDTPKIHAAMHGGAWHDPQRGRVPWNWGAQPLLLEDFPVLLEYFYESATPNDYFMGGASGAGFVYPNALADPEPYFAQVRRTFARADLHETEAWLHFSRPVYDAYARKAGLSGFSMPCGPFGVTLVDQGNVPVFLRGNSGLNYFNAHGEKQELVETIRRHCARRSTPSFSTIHCPPSLETNLSGSSFSPSAICEVQAQLGMAEYEFVTFQTLCTLAVQAVRNGLTPDCLVEGYSEWT